jgi:hypothetical protein
MTRAGTLPAKRNSLIGNPACQLQGSLAGKRGQIRNGLSVNVV